MPPPKTNKTLTAAQKETAASAGSPRGPSTSRTGRSSPPKRPAAAGGQERGLGPQPDRPLHPGEAGEERPAPAPEADRRTLARRLSLDLTGLPPSRPTSRRSSTTTSPDAYEQLVDRLLDSPHWGEHRGRYWLDAARYADTHGIHFDNYREIWAYRDWVINAFNRNLPFDQFTIEQLAGDLLPEPHARPAGRLGLQPLQHHDQRGRRHRRGIPRPLRPRPHRDDVAGLAGPDGRLRGLPRPQVRPAHAERVLRAVGVLQQHDAGRDGRQHQGHAADRLRARAGGPAALGAAGRSSRRAEQVDARKQGGAGRVRQVARPRPRGRPAGWPPTKACDCSAAERGHGRRRRTWTASSRRDADGVAWDAGTSRQGVRVRRATSRDRRRRRLREEPGVLLRRLGQAAEARASTGAVVARMDDTHDYRGWDLWIENGQRRHAHRQQVARRRAQGRRRDRRSSRTSGHHVLVTYDGSGKAAGRARSTSTASSQATDVAGRHAAEHDPHRGAVQARPAAHRRRGWTALLIQDLRLYGRALSPSEVDAARQGRRARLPGSRSPAGKRTDGRDGRAVRLVAAGRWTRSCQELAAQAGDARARGSARSSARGTIAHVMQERPEPADGLHPATAASTTSAATRSRPDTPAALPPMPAGPAAQPARPGPWLLRPEHPLTARVTVNRFWQELFGTGLVRTTGDFGVTGELPSHPELLDWLAVEFREIGLGREAVLQAAGRPRRPIGSRPRPRRRSWRRTRQNRLLSRGPRFRMDAEMIRDYALAVERPAGRARSAGRASGRTSPRASGRPWP